MKPFDTHVSKFLLNVFRSSTFGPTSQRLTAPVLGIMSDKSILAKVFGTCKHEAYSPRRGFVI